MSVSGVFRSFEWLQGKLLEPTEDETRLWRCVEAQDRAGDPEIKQVWGQHASAISKKIKRGAH